ncbi:MAG: MFS transporter [[Pasteurella] mairii]|uniref:Metabolite transport protein n=2 Tax=[Pasteurella] aerogenes-[Pasteurella] mairii-[Actinobacillus] rossii complex TaxID=310966 RepID=A0A380TPW4_9PAST|nr:MFS transporter [[Actinobacillus] rossii]MDY4280390.1 MFS transporter [[Pasteurella] mairii]MDY4593445.1 MFS transporter [[Pasteurella] aerogenes]MDY3124566.1 MFS transporter [[Actinobacillus] rossii]SUB32961.1 putative metabolite transport protein [[Pasteurella] mairii]
MPQQEHNNRTDIYNHARSEKNVRAAALAGGVGTMLEQFDFAIYGLAAALVFPQVFFPQSDPLAGALMAFAGFAVGFLARPIGGIIFAHFGEIYGRKWVLVMTLALMGVATFLIGCIPSYESIGIAAPILLFLLRLLQGLGAGAEQSGSATLLAETARIGQRGRLSSSVMVGAAAGTVCGTFMFSVVQWLIPEQDFINWGWRIVFLFSVIVTIAAWLIRRHLAESPVFEQLKRSTSENHKTEAPLVQSVKYGWKRIVQVAIMNWGPNTNSYTVQTFFVTYVTAHVFLTGTTDFFPRSTITDIQLIGAFIGMISAFMWGALSDRFGRKPIYLLIAGLATIMPFIYFNLLDSGSVFLVSVAVILGYIFAAYGNVGVQMAYFPELFGTRYRYAGVTVAREISSLIGGGIAPMICSFLLLAYGTWLPIAIYIGFTMLCSFLATLFVPETLDRDMTIVTDAVKGEDRTGF